MICPAERIRTSLDGSPGRAHDHIRVSIVVLKVVALKEDDLAFAKGSVTCPIGPRDPTPARAFLGLA